MTETGRERLLASDSFTQATKPVFGEVLRVNPESRAPLDVVRRQPGQVGLHGVFVDWSGTGGRRLDGLPSHWRVLLENTDFTDAKGVKHRFLDYKGVGAPKAVSEQNPRVQPLPYFKAVWMGKGQKRARMFGLCDRARAERDWDATQAFSKLGVRTYTPVAIVKLHELLDENGRSVGVEAAKARKHLMRNFQPVVFIRAHPEALRVRDLYAWDGDERNIPREALPHVAWQYARDRKHKNLHELISVFSVRAADNLARMHNAGYAHNGYSFSNLTLDGRIVDNEFATGPGMGDKPATASQRAWDVRTGIDAVYLLAAAAHADQPKDIQDTIVSRHARTFLSEYLNRTKPGANDRKRLLKLISHDIKGRPYEEAVRAEFASRKNGHLE